MEIPQQRFACDNRVDEQSLGWLGTESPTEAQLKDLSYANARERSEGKKLQFSHPRCERLPAMVTVSVPRTEAQRALSRSARLFAC
jgi:hypothetical protein